MKDAEGFRALVSALFTNMTDAFARKYPALDAFYSSKFVFALRRYGFSLISALIPLSIFLATVPNEPASWDTAEIQGVPYILGITHPTGFPLFTLIGYAFTHILPFGSVALRMNILCALCVTIATVVFYQIAIDLRVPKFCAVAACFWFSVALPVWTHATRAEVHDMALMFAALTVLFVLRWLSRQLEKDLMFASVSLGLGLATHPLMVWLLPGFALTVAFACPSLRLGVRCSALLCAPLALYLYLPLRSAMIVASHADPTLGLQGIHGGLFWNYNNPSTWAGFVAEITGSQFAAGGSALSSFTPATLQGFLWNFITSLDTAFGAFSLVLAAIGVVRLWNEGWRRCLAFITLTLCIIPFSYGYGVEGDSERYRLLCYAAFTILMACAALPRGRERIPLVRTAVVTSLMLLWASETMWNNRATFANRYDGGPRALITEVARAVPKRSIIVTSWVDATALAYASYVEKTLNGRIVVAGWFNEYAPDYAMWAKSYRVYLLGSQPPDIPQVVFKDAGSLDGSHHLWLVAKGLRCWRDPHTNRMFGPDALDAVGSCGLTVRKSFRQHAYDPNERSDSD